MADSTCTEDERAFKAHI